MTSVRAERPGFYRRRQLTINEPGLARGEMEDDPHRYTVRFEHDGRRVTRADGIPIRTPWTLCPEAVGALGALVGATLDPDLLAPGRLTNPRLQCTHMFDIACLALSHAARGIARRQYDVSVRVDLIHGPREAQLRRDGEIVFDWIADTRRILSPAPYAGREIAALLAWAREDIKDPDLFEAIFVLRRALGIARSRDVELDRFHHAGSGALMGACYVLQPERAPKAARVKGSTLDFSDAPDALLADVAETRRT